MRRLYLRIYLAVLASLLFFAIMIGVLWRFAPQVGPAGYAYEVAGVLATAVLAPDNAPLPDQQAAVKRLAARLATDVTLFDRARAPIASSGDVLRRHRRSAAPVGSRTWAGASRGRFRLEDGRWVVVRLPAEVRSRSVNTVIILTVLALAIAVAAYPVAKLVARLERLQKSVVALGAGDLRARVKVEGRDEIAHLAESFNQSADRIEALVGAHKALLANTSHELRTPLARIRMGLELMGDPPDEKRLAQLRGDIAELDGLIDEILLASRLDAVQDTLAPEEIDLLALAAEECARYERCTLDGDHASVRGDAKLLRRAIRNLLENARRHAPGSPVEVTVRRAGNDHVEVAVRDHGQGIAAVDAERVFEPFYRARAGAASASGTGLGLPLVRMIARRHGGDAACRQPPDGPGALLVMRLASRA